MGIDPGDAIERERRLQAEMENKRKLAEAEAAYAKAREEKLITMRHEDIRVGIEALVKELKQHGVLAKPEADNNNIAVIKDLKNDIEELKNDNEHLRSKVSWLEAKADTAERAVIRSYNYAIEEAAKVADNYSHLAQRSIRALKKEIKD